MLAALNIPALGLGIAGGGLTATVFALGLGGVLSLTGVPNGADIGLLLGVVLGLFSGGWLAGRNAVHSHRFHGSVVGLMLAGIIILLASMGGANASVLNVIWLAVVAITTGGLGGWMGGRKRLEVR